MEAGIVGLPGSGRRTLFRLLTRVAGEPAPTRHAQRGVLRIADERLAELARLHGSRKMTPATIGLVLVPGLVKGDADEALNLPALRTVDVLLAVVRAFDEPSVPHPEGSVDPARDAQSLELELALSDLAVVERRLERLAADAGKGKKADPQEVRLLEKSRAALEEETPLRAVLTEEEQRRLKGYALLTAKPLLLVVNVDEADAARADLAARLGLDAWTAKPRVGLVFVSARIEAEMAELDEADAAAFRAELGLAEDTPHRIVRAAFDLMDLVVFYTAGEQEARAWIVPRGTRAVEAAGTIHTDMARGFIRAEVVPYEALLEAGSWSACRESGRLRLEGKDYPIADGDVVFFRFNV